MSPGNPFANAALQASRASFDEDDFDDAKSVDEEEELHQEDLATLQVGGLIFRWMKLGTRNVLFWAVI